MPVFFIVGGYANAVSLESARRKNLGYAGWLVTRLNRLVSPLLVLLLVWAGLAVILHFFRCQQQRVTAGLTSGADSDLVSRDLFDDRRACTGYLPLLEALGVFILLGVRARRCARRRCFFSGGH